MKRPPILVATATRPDLDAATGAILPMFLAFLAGRLKRQSAEGEPPPPATASQPQEKAP